MLEVRPLKVSGGSPVHLRSKHQELVGKTLWVKYIYIYTHTHIYIHAYMHTYVHTYIHTYIYVDSSDRTLSQAAGFFEMPLAGLGAEGVIRKLSGGSFISYSGGGARGLERCRPAEIIQI